VGKSQPPPARLDLVGSYARRRGDDVEIVLNDPQVSVPERTEAVLRHDRRTVPFRAKPETDEHGNKRLLLTGPRTQLRNGTWSITLQTPEGKYTVEARLLVQGDRPLVLLWGAKGELSALPQSHNSLAARQRIAATGGRLLDRALRMLPPERAERVRASARRAARRVLH
jgi:hypothetical protein